ncbi:MAG: hypothetical protein KDB01_13620 [Planctomycetaceae bacterium]|nr:hypothetical protein [Planctomycetaceae bacterium]
MNQPRKILIAGIGSAHGDDQAGWLVAEHLAARIRDCGDIKIRKAMIPLDLLDWLDGVDILHVCDACEMTPCPEKLHRFTWVAAQWMKSDQCREADIHVRLRSPGSGGSHDFGLIEVLRLAAETRQLPQQVIIWAVEGLDFNPEGTISSFARIAAGQAADAIFNDLRIHDA